MASRAVIGRLVAAAYVATVAGLAGAGFANDSTVAILLGVALTLPFGAIALIGFYLAYGILAQVPGANPDVGRGGSHCDGAGVCTTWSTGDLAPWFQFTTDAIGVGLLTVAAIANLLWVWPLGRAPRARPGSPSRATVDGSGAGPLRDW